MKKIIVTSTNPVKVEATRSGFQKMFPGETFATESIEVHTGVDKQPQTDAETFQGAMNRVINANRAVPEADYWVGIEGGIEEKSGETEAFAWVVIKSKDGKIGKGRTGTFFLPPAMIQLIKQGKELGEADDIVFNQVNSKQKNGTVGNLTGHEVTRTKYYVDAVIFALIPFRNRELY